MTLKEWNAKAEEITQAVARMIADRHGITEAQVHNRAGARVDRSAGRARGHLCYALRSIGFSLTDVSDLVGCDKSHVKRSSGAWFRDRSESCADFDTAIAHRFKGDHPGRRPRPVHVVTKSRTQRENEARRLEGNRIKRWASNGAAPQTSEPEEDRPAPPARCGLRIFSWENEAAGA